MHSLPSHPLRTVAAALATLLLVAGAAAGILAVPGPHRVGGVVHPVVGTGGQSTDRWTDLLQLAGSADHHGKHERPPGGVCAGTDLPREGDTTATLEAFTPQQGQSPGQWPGEGLSSATPFPNASAPSPLPSSSLPLVTGSSGDYPLSDYITDYPNTLTDADAGVYVLRLFTGASGKPQSTSYDSADILISGTTWTLVYTQAPTTTTLSVSP